MDTAEQVGPQDEQAFGATSATEVAIAGVVAAETVAPEISLTVIGSGVNANGGKLDTVGAAPAENSSQNPGVQILLFVSGLLLAIVAFFFFMSRKRQPGD